MFLGIFEAITKSPAPSVITASATLYDRLFEDCGAAENDGADGEATERQSQVRAHHTSLF